MKPISISLPDGSKKTFPSGTTPLTVAQSIGKKLASDTLAARVNGKEVDVYYPLQEDCELKLITRTSAEGLDVLRHSTAHLLAHAIKELYPKAQITIGPVIEDGFYYDIDCPTALTPQDLPKIEDKMREIAKRGLDVKRRESSKKEAIEFFRKDGEIYKAEIIEGIPETTVSLYSQGGFTDLCRGPHVPNTSQLGAFKLLSLAGAYWRGDEKNKMLQRIYGTAFATEKDLEAHLHRIEEAKRRDHRKLGPEMGMFDFLSAAPSMPFYLPKGSTLVKLLMDYIRSEILGNGGYQEVMCPQLMTTELWKTSGHWDHYRENMFIMQAEEPSSQMGLKPMNCPGHCVLFGSQKRSYRELPLRYAEFTKLHRDERAGVTHGLFRTRAFSQDDGHIFCTHAQIVEESERLVTQIIKTYRKFGFNDVEIRLATRPEKAMGDPKIWEEATDALKASLDKNNTPFTFAQGDGAFYGPKIEVHIKDCLNRLWQCGTVQLDYNLPERFKLEYVDSDNTSKRPVMIHRAIFGSIERFMGILIEHHAGHLPFWIAPQQIVIINITDAQQPYARELQDKLRAWGYRSEVDLRNEKLGYKIREAQMQKVPLMLVIGGKEVETQSVSLRHAVGDNQQTLNISQLQNYLESLNNNPGGINH